MYMEMDPDPAIQLFRVPDPDPIQVILAYLEMIKKYHIIDQKRRIPQIYAIFYVFPTEKTTTIILKHL